LAAVFFAISLVFEADLVKEEHALYGQGKLSDGDHQRLRTSRPGRAA
jgi:hypothetical protein